MNETKKEKELEAIWPAYRRMLRMLWTVPDLTAATGLFLLVALALSLARPWILGSAVDALESAAAGSQDLAPVATRFGAMFLGVTLVMNAFRFLYGDARGRLTQTIVANIRLRALEKLHVLSPVYYGENDSGQIIARVSRDVQKMRPFFGLVVFSILQLGIIVIGTFLFMASQSLLLASVTVLFFLATAVMLYYTARRLQPLNRQADDMYDGVALDIKENIEGVKIVKSFGRESRQVNRFASKLDDYIRRTIAVSDFWSVRMPISDSIFGLSIPVILLIGGGLVIEGDLKKGAIVSSLFYAGRIFHELRSLIRLVGMSQEAGVSAQRFFELIDDTNTVPSTESPLALPKGRGALVFEKVGFGYKEEDEIISDLSFNIRPGECVALVGPTGSGKSTVLSLLLRFFDPARGNIYLDGADIRRLSLADLRSAVGCVFQETFLFSATLRENLAFAATQATDEKIRKAVETAQLGKFLSELPEGLDTIVGERGVTLSGGQKQRAAIARALLSDPRLLILDDAMASVDAQTESGLVHALREAAKERTTLLITQRLSGVLLADRAIVVDKGGVVDEGSHPELYGRCRIYKELFEGQVLETAV
jgi:ATP-binding cassette subfamily B protein